MAKSLADLTSYINEMLPNRMNSTTIIDIINSEMLKIFRDMTSTDLSTSITTVANQQQYALPTNCDFDMIIENGIRVFSSAGSTIFQIYRHAGVDDIDNIPNGNRYFEGLTGNFGLYPTPTVSGMPVTVKFQARPSLFGFATTDSTTIVPLDQDYVELLEYRTMARIAKSGNSPDIEMANNYTADSIELRRELKFKRANEKMKTSRHRFSYKDWER